MGLLDPMLLRLGVSQKIVDAATGTGTAKSQIFQFPQPQTAAQIWSTLQAILTGAFTALVIGIEVSLDAGTTYHEIAEWDGFAKKAIRGDFGITGLYRLNLKTFTGGTNVTVYIGVP